VFPLAAVGVLSIAAARAGREAAASKAAPAAS
jgi:hypothetical protein